MRIELDDEEFDNQEWEEFDKLCVMPEAFRIAYLLASFDGKLSPGKKALFRFLFQKNNNMCFLDRKVNKQLLNFIVDAEKLRKLSEIYNQDELMMTFISMIDQDYNKILASDKRSWHAMVVWILIGTVDKKQSRLLQRALKLLQEQMITGEYGIPYQRVHRIDFDPKGEARRIEKEQKLLKALEETCVEFNDLRKRIIEEEDFSQLTSLHGEFRDFEIKVCFLIDSYYYFQQKE